MLQGHTYFREMLKHLSQFSTENLLFSASKQLKPNYTTKSLKYSCFI